MSQGSKQFNPSSFGQAVSARGFHTPQPWERVETEIKRSENPNSNKKTYEVNFDERWLSIPDDQLEIKTDPVSDAPMVDADGNYLTVKTKTRIKNEIAELSSAAYTNFLKKLFKTFDEYSKTLVWFSREIHRARSANQFLEIPVRDRSGAVMRDENGNEVKHKFSYTDVNKIASLIRSATNIGKFYLRGTKKASRKNSKPGDFTSIYKPVKVSDAFRQLVAGLPDFVAGIANMQGAQWSQTVRGKLIELQQLLNGGNSVQLIVQEGFAQKMACTNLIYIIGYLSNTLSSYELARSSQVMQASTDNGVEQLTKTFESQTLEVLLTEKSRYLGGAFAAPDYMVEIMKNNASSVKLVFTSSGKVGGFTRPVEWKATEQPQSIMQVMSDVGAAQSKPFNVKAIPMNLVGRLLSTFILPAKVPVPENPQDRELIVGETLAVKAMLKLAHDITYADRKNIYRYRKALDKVIASKRRKEYKESTDVNKPKTGPKAFPKNVL